MSRIAKLISFVLLPFCFAACTSALKKQCKETNWFEHGRTVALDGKRLSEDDFVKRCEGEGVAVNSGTVDLGFKSGMQQYCTLDQALITGKNGQKLTVDFCEPNLIRQLQGKHREGVNQYCQADNGRIIGAAGKIYTKICTPKQEETFLVEYARGRIIYLDQLVLSKQEESARLDREISFSREEVGRLYRSLAFLPPSTHVVQVRTQNPVTQQWEVRNENVRNEHAASERQNLESRINSENYSISNKQRRQEILRQEITSHRIEKDSLVAQAAGRK